MMRKIPLIQFAIGIRFHGEGVFEGFCSNRGPVGRLFHFSTYKTACGGLKTKLHAFSN